VAGTSRAREMPAPCHRSPSTPTRAQPDDGSGAGRRTDTARRTRAMPRTRRPAWRRSHGRTCPARELGRGRTNLVRAGRALFSLPDSGNLEHVRQQDLATLVRQALVLVTGEYELAGGRVEEALRD